MALHSQVRRRVHDIVAKICAWSLEHAASGKGPDVGFYEEDFPPNTWRSQMRGKPLAGGIRHHQYPKRFLVCFRVLFNYR